MPREMPDEDPPQDFPGGGLGRWILVFVALLALVAAMLIVLAPTFRAVTRPVTSEVRTCWRQNLNPFEGNVLCEQRRL